MADSAPPPAQPVPRTRSITFLTAIAACAVAADLATKAWAKATLGPDVGRAARRIDVVRNHFDFIYALNPGGAWSFLRGLPEYVRRPFFLSISAAAIVFIVSVYLRLPRERLGMRVGLPLALGGAIGNLVDRIRYGQVIDFIDWYVKRGDREHHWPTFNVADVAIVVGVALMAIGSMRKQRERAGASAQPEATPLADSQAAANPPSAPSV